MCAGHVMRCSHSAMAVRCGIGGVQEEMELLLQAVRDAASNRGGPSEAQHVEALIDSLRALSPGRDRPPGPAAAAAATAAYSAALRAGSASPSPDPDHELDRVRAKLEDDNRRLKAELLSARKMLTERLR